MERREGRIHAVLTDHPTRKEVVIVTTASSTPTTAPTVPITPAATAATPAAGASATPPAHSTTAPKKNTAKKAWDKFPDFRWDFITLILILIIQIVQFLVLFGVADSKRDILTFDDDSYKILGWFNSALMLIVIVRTLIDRRYMLSRLIVSLGWVAFFWLFGFNYLQDSAESGGQAEKLWALAEGWVVLFAFIAQGLATFFLSASAWKSEDRQKAAAVKVARSRKRGLAAKVIEEELLQDTLTTNVESAKTAEINKTTEYSDAQAASNAAADKEKEAQEKYTDSDEVKHLKKSEERLAAIPKELEEKEEEIQAHNAVTPQPPARRWTPAQAKNRQGKLNNLTDSRDDLLNEQFKLEEEVGSLRDEDKIKDAMKEFLVVRADYTAAKGLFDFLSRKDLSGLNATEIAQHNKELNEARQKCDDLKIRMDRLTRQLGTARIAVEDTGLGALLDDAKKENKKAGEKVEEVRVLLENATDAVRVAETAKEESANRIEANTKTTEDDKVILAEAFRSNLAGGFGFVFGCVLLLVLWYLTIPATYGHVITYPQLLG